MSFLRLLLTKTNGFFHPKRSNGSVSFTIGVWSARFVCELCNHNHFLSKFILYRRISFNGTSFMMIMCFSFDDLLEIDFGIEIFTAKKLPFGISVQTIWIFSHKCHSRVCVVSFRPHTSKFTHLFLGEHKTHWFRSRFENVLTSIRLLYFSVLFSAILLIEDTHTRSEKNVLKLQLYFDECLSLCSLRVFFGIWARLFLLLHRWIYNRELFALKNKNVFFSSLVFALRKWFLSSLNEFTTTSTVWFSGSPVFIVVRTILSNFYPHNFVRYGTIFNSIVLSIHFGYKQIVNEFTWF